MGNVDTKHTLAPTQVTQYEHDGFLFPIPVLSADEVLQYRAALEELEAQLGGTVKPAQLVQPHLHFKFPALAGRTTESSTMSQKGERP